ncbi:MAG: ribonuclease R [Alphaproteobacteria bacterium]|nr:ribonuclease R [Alphaproteobacteria bacterium]
MARKTAPLPTKDQLREFIAESPTPVGKREIARAFQVKGEDRVALKAMLRELSAEGTVGKIRKAAPPPGRLAEVVPVVVTGVDEDGETMVRPLVWESESEPPRIVLVERPGAPALLAGTRVLARLSKRSARLYEARVLRRIPTTSDRVVGTFRLTSEGGRLTPADKRSRTEFRVSRVDSGGARDGELVSAEVLTTTRQGIPEARVIERLGSADDPRAIGALAVAAHAIPVEFSHDAIGQAEAAEPVTQPGKREDLRELPLVTIDGDDARDFDDAVFAEADDEGWKLVVAIADVAHYVTPASPLDRDAFKRGNSVYLPDRVVPMLPEALSNELCSLKPKVPRPVMACFMRIDKEGRLIEHRFSRALMRSAARLTYEQVQNARDGRPDDTTGPLMERVIEPLYGAYRALIKAREKRGTLDLDIPERRVFLGPDGDVLAIRMRARFDSHRLIEEFMIAANVAAAEALEAKGVPCMYRVHDRPSYEKLEGLRDFLDSIGLSLPKGQVLQPKSFMRLLVRAEDTPYKRMVNDLVLRSQAQAQYSPDNLGHFGLALRRYAHFTSPIRRYSDVLVHRGLIKALALGDDGLTDAEAAKMRQLGEHISMTERRAQVAERDAVDRYTALYLSSQVGGEFAGRISGVSRFGLFIALDETGADGLIPISTLGADFFEHDERQHRLVGRKSKVSFQLGQPVRVRLADADPVKGGLVFQMLQAERADGRPERPLRRSPGAPRHRPGKRRRG